MAGDQRRLFVRDQFFKSLAGAGFHRKSGYVASWRPLYRGQDAIKIISSPFESFDEAGAACDTILKHLMSHVVVIEWRLHMETDPCYSGNNYRNQPSSRRTER
jgi:hypothetical protein